jgi:sugar lactone lactonase YvrE
VTELEVLTTNVQFGEQPRWHEGRLWFSDWGPPEIAIDLEGHREVILNAPGLSLLRRLAPRWAHAPGICPRGTLLRLVPDGSLVTHGDLKQASDPAAGNELVVDAHGNAYVDGGGFDLLAGEDFAPGGIVLVRPDGSATQVADQLACPNGMHIMGDGSTLLVAESYAKRLTAFQISADGSLSNRRVLADLGDGVPDGICVDADDAVWYGDVPNQRSVRVREGGEVLQRVELDRGCFACALGGADTQTLFMMATVWRGPENMFDGPRTGQVVTTPAPAQRAGWP